MNFFLIENNNCEIKINKLAKLERKCCWEQSIFEKTLNPTTFYHELYPKYKPQTVTLNSKFNL